MNDRLKFRAWCKELPKHLAMMRVAALDSEGVVIRKGDPSIITDMNLEDGGGCFLLEDVILMQSTGLRDSKGVLVYDGDIQIAEDKSTIYVVEWRNSIAGFEGKLIKKKELEFIKLSDGLGTIIGNIYQDPELLK